MGNGWAQIVFTSPTVRERGSDQLADVAKINFGLGSMTKLLALPTCLNPATIARWMSIRTGMAGPASRAMKPPGLMIRRNSARSDST